MLLIGGMLDWRVLSGDNVVRAHYPENWTPVEAGKFLQRVGLITHGPSS